MKRTLVLFVLSLTALIIALLLPRGAPVPAAPPKPPPVDSGQGSLTITARPSKRAFLASGDNLSVVYEIAARAKGGERRPVDFALVLDRSGSMTGEPLEKAKAAAQSLVGRLTAADRLSVIHFGSEAHLTLPLTPMDSAGQAAARAAIAQVQADGGTNMSAALELGESTLREAPVHETAMRRVVLLGDGEANEGTVGPELVDLARQESSRGLRISALGLGVDFDEELMMSLASVGGGQYRYLRDGDEVASALTSELAAASATVATSVDLAVTPAAGVSILESPGVTPDATTGAWRFRLNDLAAGETRHVTVVLRTGAASTGVQPLLDAQLSYTDVPAGRVGRTTGVLASSESTADASAVARSYDAEAMKVAMRARWGGTMLEAGRLYRQNRIDEARRVLHDRATEFKKESAGLGAEGTELTRTMEAERDSAGSFLAAPPTSPSARAALKSFAKDGWEATR